MLAGAVASSVVGQVAFGVVPLLQKIIIDDVVLGTEPLAPWAAAVVALGAVHFVATFARRFLGGRFALEVQHDLRRAIHHHAQRLDLAAHDRLGLGELMTRATADVTLVGNFLNQWNIIVGNAMQLAVAVVVMVVLSPALATVVLVLLPVFGIVAAGFRRRVFPATWADQQAQATLAGSIDDAVSGVRVVKAFGQEQREVGRLTALSDQLFASRLRTARITGRYTAALRMVPAVGQVGVLALGGWLAIEGRITLGTFLAFSSYLVQLVGPTRMLSGVVITAQQARTGAARVLALLDLTPTITTASAAVDMPRGGGRVTLEDVTFSYPGAADPVLQSCSLTIEAGERVALVGASGSGKSTIAHLVARFHDPDTGVVRLDGHDVAGVTLASLRRAIGLVFEDTFLFSRSIRENLLLARPDAADTELRAVLEIASAAEFVDRLPAGLDTPVGEDGLSLSGGQRQRIALARTLLTDPDILILDDATSSVDAATEARIHHRLEEVLAGRTVILLAHRRSTLALSDRVVVLADGHVVADGDHDHLLSTCPAYQRLLEGDHLATDRQPADDLPANGNRNGPATDVDRRAWPALEDIEGAGSLEHAQLARSSTAAVASTSSGGGAVDGFNKTITNAGLMEATPELLAAVGALPPLRDDPAVDVARETAPERDGRFGLGRFLRPYAIGLGLGLGFVVVDTLIAIVGPLFIRHGVDDGVANADYVPVLLALVGLTAVAVAGWANTWAMTVQTTRTSERLILALRLRSFAHLQRLSLEYYEREMSGRIFARMTADVESLSSLFQQGIVVGAAGIVTSLGLAIAMTVLAPGLAVAVAVLVPPAAIATVAFQRRSRNTYSLARRRIAAVYADMSEGLNGVRISQALRAEDALGARFDDLCEQYRAARLRSLRLSALFFTFVQWLSLAAKVIVFAVGAPRVADGDLTAGVLIAFVLYLDQFFSPIQQLSQTFDHWLAARESLERITELLDTPSGTPEADQPRPVPNLRGDIRLHGVRFAYRDDAPEVLRGIDVHIPAGQRVALVGATGAGKSTLAKLVTRFYDPTAGVVSVDGMPLPHLELAAYRRQLGYVPQEPLLFAGSIRDNIAYGRPDATELDIKRAARRVGAHDVVAGLPRGYRTIVNRRGRSLSAGERQLICLARAELVRPSILVLDEATANLDLATEAAVQDGMARAAAGRTTIIIAHRLQTIRMADRILVIDHGQVIEDGSHEELADADGHYARLVASGRAGTDLVEDELVAPA
ncbi:MAG: ABC transporter ATP-binding protein [Acidimicrobiia bacterium]